MAAIKFINSMNHEQVLNLNRITSVEVAGSQAALTIYFGKDHITINFKNAEERDDVFDRICKAYGISEANKIAQA